MMATYLRLCWEFFKTGLFAIGGGMATLPFLTNIGETTGWYTQTELMNMLAVSESTPGPIGINMATYVGFTVGGVPGAILATLSEVAPSIIIILIIAVMLKKFRDSKYVNNAFYGLRPASTGLIGAAAKMRPSKSVMDMELPSLKKKFKDKKFAAGCSRDVIKTGAEELGWELDELLERTMVAMRVDEEAINAACEAL